uniref:HCO3_cotransp domain-containing protein n=1 Tax=Hymenolepis diminuta TaxID=6216 RepID=A0A0R3SVI3_HYMDI
LFILITEMPFCCAFIPQTEYITRMVEKIGPLPIAIILALLGIIAMAMCPSISMGFALCFLLGSAALRIREFILLRSVSTLNKQSFYFDFIVIIY